MNEASKDYLPGAGYMHRDEWHFVDHVGPICDLLGIPLIFFNEKDFALAKEFYPHFAAELHMQGLTIEYLVSHYDYMVASGVMGRDRLKKKIQAYEQKFHKTFRFIHCPHGFSDKIAYLSFAVREDISLMYGQNHIDHIKALNMFDQLHSYVLVGNYRFSYYQKYQSHCDQITKEKIFNQFSNEAPYILYAPTWNDYDGASTFASFCTHLIKRLPDAYNLIVKLHPRILIEEASTCSQIIKECAHKKNVVIVDQFPLIYPILAKTDLYIGDASSIGYDFLTFNKPMFFLNKLQRDPFVDRRAYLLRCGTVVHPENFEDIFSIIEKSLPTDTQQFEETRAQVYAYTFGLERPLETIKRDILSAVRL